MERIIGKTRSVCPVCLKQIPAEKVERDGIIYMKKSCPEHGESETVIWRGLEDYEGWRGNLPELQPGENENCPHGCGLCQDHLRDTCCVLLEITNRCNLNCTFCFADPEGARDPSLEQVKAWIRDLVKPGKTLLQLSGGEPTVREDLPEIIAYARECGCKYVQLNSNGLRLAEEPDYAGKLAAAGLSFVFLQFDGTGDKIYQKLRKRPLMEQKEECIRCCGEAGLGVTLVPTLVPGINITEIRDIMRFAVKHSPVVRGVHFQPVSYFGRIPEIPSDSQRFTLDQLMHELEKQTKGLVKKENLAPSCCDHPMCGFHGDFVVMPDRSLYPLTIRRSELEKLGTDGTVNPADKNREFVGRRWVRQVEEEGCCGDNSQDFNGVCGNASTEGGDCCCGPDLSDMEVFLNRARGYRFTVTSMAFQDAGNLDIERLRRCSLHVYRNGKHVPFCANYLSPFPTSGN